MAEDASYEEDVRRSEDSPSTPELERGVLFFIISLLDHIVRDWEYESPLVCALAIIAVQPQGWLGVDRYPSLLSALIKTSRYLVLQEAYERRPEDGDSDSNTTPNNSDTDTDTDTDADTLNASAVIGRGKGRTTGPRLEDVEQMTRRFLRRGTRSPFEWMFDLRSYGQHLAMQSTSGGRVGWTGDRLSYGDISLDMSQLRRMVSLLSYDTRHILDSSLLLGLPTPAISIQSLADNPGSSEAGFSFVRHSETRNLLEFEGGR